MPWLLAGAVVLFAAIVALNADPAGVSAQQPKDAAKAGASDESDDKPITVAEARERARLLHSVYSTTLEVMHHRYFRSDHAVLPARAMEDIFRDMEKESNIKSRWISVNTTAMSIHHEPEDEFEKKAAREIAGGKSEYEQVENGVYQRAGAIPLRAGCIGCHTRMSTAPDKTPRFAGLVIRIPVKEK